MKLSLMLRFILSLLAVSSTMYYALTEDDVNLRLEENWKYFDGTASAGWVANMYGMCSPQGSSGYAQVLNEDPLFNASKRLVMGSLTKSMTVVLLSMLLSENKIEGQSPVQSNTTGTFGYGS